MPKVPVRMDTKCKWCGQPFTLKIRRPTVFCSRTCKDQAKNHARQDAIDAAKPDRRCVHCGKSLPKSMRADAKFCSTECNSAAHQATRKMSKRAGSKRSGLVSRAEIAERDAWRCGICGGRVSKARKHPDPLAPSIDHVVPLAAGGTNDSTNLQLAHLRCNLSKRDRPANDQLRLV